MNPKFIPLYKFLHRKVILENMRDMFSLFSQYFCDPAENEEESRELGSLFLLHEAILDVTGQVAQETKTLKKDLNALHVNSVEAEIVLSNLNFKTCLEEPIDWPTILTVGKMGSICNFFKVSSGNNYGRETCRFGIFSDEASW